MANICSFRIKVHGQSEDVERFLGYFRDSMEDGPGDGSNDEVYVRLDDGTFGEFNPKEDIPYLWMLKEGVQITPNGDVYIDGWCNSQPPITYLEQVSNLMPIWFSVGCTIEHELLQDWKVSQGCSDLIYQEIIPVGP